MRFYVMEIFFDWKTNYNIYEYEKKKREKKVIIFTIHWEFLNLIMSLSRSCVGLFLVI